MTPYFGAVNGQPIRVGKIIRAGSAVRALWKSGIDSRCPARRRGFAVPGRGTALWKTMWKTIWKTLGENALMSEAYAIPPSLL